MNLRVLIVDDSPFVQRMIVDWLKDEPGIEVVGVCNDGEEAVKMAVELKPDVITRSPKIKAWSAGRSYRAEAYTLAMILDKFDGSHQIIGADIDEEALFQARRGEFSDNDLIMCRNVVIYFTEVAKTELYKRFFNALKPGGYLFVGSTERIHKSDEMGYQNGLPFFYQKPLLGGNQWQSAS